MVDSKKKFKKGFGLLEVLIAGVIVITILAALVFVGKTALDSSLNAQARAQGIFLAQEAIEKIRQIRDTNWTDGDNTTQWNYLVWDSTNSVFKPVSDGCYIVNEFVPPLATTTRFALSPTTSLDCGNDISANEANWGEVTVDNIPFKRVVKIENISSLKTSNGTIDDSALKITAFIQWRGRGGYQIPPISVSEIITNWRPNY